MPLLLRCEESSPVVINNFFFFLYSRTFSNVRANQTQHDRSLGEKKKHPAQRAEKKSELIMNIHAAGGLNDCCFTGLWAVAKQFVRKEMAEKVSFLSTFSHPPLKFPNINVTDQQWTGLCVPTSDSQNPNSNSFFFTPVYFFPSVSEFVQKSFFFLCEVMLSRMANKQSHRCTGQSTLQHFRSLFQLAACLTSAGWSLLTQDYVSWTEIGGSAKAQWNLCSSSLCSSCGHLSWHETTNRKEVKKGHYTFITQLLCVHNPLKASSPSQSQRCTPLWHLHVCLPVPFTSWLSISLSLHSLAPVGHRHPGGHY